MRVLTLSVLGLSSIVTACWNAPTSPSPGSVTVIARSVLTNLSANQTIRLSTVSGLGTGRQATDRLTGARVIVESRDSGTYEFVEGPPGTYHSVMPVAPHDELSLRVTHSLGSVVARAVVPDSPNLLQVDTARAPTGTFKIDLALDAPPPDVVIGVYTRTSSQLVAGQVRFAGYADGPSISIVPDSECPQGACNRITVYVVSVPFNVLAYFGFRATDEVTPIQGAEGVFGAVVGDSAVIELI